MSHESSPPAPFLADYASLRTAFLDASRRAGATLAEYVHPLPGPAGDTLATDVAVIGQPDAAKRLVIISGTHGVEGPFGSSCQTAWLRGHQAWDLPPDTAVVMIHLINPWGAAWSRRVNEDNVDLNRNFIDWAGTPPANESYEALHGKLVQDAGNPPAVLAEAGNVVRPLEGMEHSEVARVVEAGQYAHPDGLFYGGAGPTWSNGTLRAILATFVAGARQAVVFDLHTGAGPYNYPALLSVSPREHDGLAWGRALFGPALSIVLTGKEAHTDTGIAATATGYVSAAVLDALPGTKVLPLVIECGTLDGPTVMHAVREDNWLHQAGKLDSLAGQRIKATLRKAFVPEDVHWQSNCLDTSIRYFDRALAGLRTAERGLAPTKSQDVATPQTEVPALSARDTARATPALQVLDLHKSFGSVEVLRGVGVSAAAGEVVSMIGSSGSGKSTFLRCINLLEQPNGGRIIVGGEEIKLSARRDGSVIPADMRQVERIRSRVGMVFQNFNLWPHMTVLENIVEAPIHVLREARDDAIAHAHELLKKVGLSEKHGQYPGQLSGGQQQRAAIARTLAMRPNLILLDEPTSALDPELVGEVLRVIRQLAEEGNTMILVTHEMQFAREVSHKILFLHQGQVEEEGAPTELFANPRSGRLRQFLARAT